jgi:hypothetical protein
MFLLLALLYMSRAEERVDRALNTANSGGRNSDRLPGGTLEPAVGKSDD